MKSESETYKDYILKLNILDLLFALSFEHMHNNNERRQREIFIFLNIIFNLLFKSILFEKFHLILLDLKKETTSHILMKSY